MLSEHSLEVLVQREEQKRAGKAAEAMPAGLQRAIEETKREIEKAFKEKQGRFKVEVKK